MNGTVVRLVRTRGFGFIEGADGNEYFFHRSEVELPYTFERAREQDAVEFDVVPSERGPRATNVVCV